MIPYVNANELLYESVFNICDFDNKAWCDRHWKKVKCHQMFIIPWPLTLLTQDTISMIIKNTNKELKCIPYVISDEIKYHIGVYENHRSPHGHFPEIRLIKICYILWICSQILYHDMDKNENISAAINKIMMCRNKLADAR